MEGRVYWRIGSYERDWEKLEYGKVGYRSIVKGSDNMVRKKSLGGVGIGKLRNGGRGLYRSVVRGLEDGMKVGVMG